MKRLEAYTNNLADFHMVRAIDISNRRFCIGLSIGNNKAFNHNMESTLVLIIFCYTKVGRTICYNVLLTWEMKTFLQMKI